MVLLRSNQNCILMRQELEKYNIPAVCLKSGNVYAGNEAAELYIILDAVISFLACFALEGIAWQIVLYIAGLFICAIGVALLFHTYFPPEAYELFVKELSQKFGMTISNTKTIYDCCSCVLGVVLSLCFSKHLLGCSGEPLFVHSSMVG